MRSNLSRAQREQHCYGKAETINTLAMSGLAAHLKKQPIMVTLNSTQVDHQDRLSTDLNLQSFSDISL